MKTYMHLALSYLKKQKDRTVALVLGIALAVMFVFGFNVINESQSRNQIAAIQRRYGTYHGIFYDLDKDEVEKIRRDENIIKSAVSFDLGNAITDNGVLMVLNSSDEDYIKMAGYNLVKGRLPQKQGEIVLESKALKNMGSKINIDDTVKLKVKREYIDEKGMKQVYMDTKPFRLVGIINKPGDSQKIQFYSLKGFTYFKKGEKNVLPDDLVSYAEIFKFKSSRNMETTTNQLKKIYGVDKTEANRNLVIALTDAEVQSSNNLNNRFNISIIITAILLIYNMFNISLIDMVKQIGTLRTIGASKKQVRFIVGFQSLFVLVGGLALGFVMGIVFSYFSIKVYNFMPSLIDVSKSSMYISSKSIWNAVGVGVITVAVSTMIPIWMAGRVTPMEAVKKTDKSQEKQRSGWHHRIGKRFFGLIGEMAYENIWRNKWRTFIIVVSVAMGGYIFIDYVSFYNDRNRFSNMVDPATAAMQDNDFRLSYSGNTDPDFVGYTEEDLKEISNIKGVKNVRTKILKEGFLELNIKELNNDYIKYKGITNEKTEIPIEVKGYDNNQLEGFQKYVAKGDILSLKESTDEYPNVAVFNYYYNKVTEDMRYREIRSGLDVGDIITIRIPVIENNKFIYKKYKVRISAMLKKEWAFKGDTEMSEMEIIFPQQYLKEISDKASYDQISLQVESGSDEYVYGKIMQILKNKPFPDIESKAGHREEIEKASLSSMKSQMVVVVLVLLVAGINVYNTIRTNLLIRINEFSIMRAIGMTVKQLKSMIIKEAVLYGILGSIIAMLLGTYRVYSFNKYTNNLHKVSVGITNTIPFKFPIIPVLLYSGIVIGICILSAYISARKVGKFNIVDGLNVTE